jgi:hypothetical protein
MTNNNLAIYANTDTTPLPSDCYSLHKKKYGVIVAATIFIAAAEARLAFLKRNSENGVDDSESEENRPKRPITNSRMIELRKWLGSRERKLSFLTIKGKKLHTDRLSDRETDLPQRRRICGHFRRGPPSFF